MQKYILISMFAIGLLLMAGCPGSEQKCPDTELIVCGADGVTYTNPCFAHEAGVSVAHDGPCTSPAPQSGDCADGDGGKDIFLAASTLGPDGNYQDDYCKDSSIVVEYYCDSAGEVAYSELPCPSGYLCLQGACAVAPCEDSDLGLKPQEKGTVTSGEESETDTCESETQLKEYICSNGAISYEVVDCPANQHCVDGACTEYECVDSDDGQEEGELGTTSKGTASQTDECYSATTVKEYYCEGGIIKSKNIACGSDEECVDGVCVEKETCVDTDGGEDKFTVGTTSYEETSYTDGCYSEATVLEYYCDGTQIKTKTLVCGVGYECVAGRCVEELCEEEDLDETPVRYELFHQGTITLYEGDAVELEADGTKYMLELTSTSGDNTSVFALYENFEDYDEGDDLCGSGEGEMELDNETDDLCGEEVNLKLDGVDDEEGYVTISSNDDFNVVQYLSQEGKTYDGSGCPDDVIEEETSFFYPALTSEFEDEKFNMLNLEAQIDEIDLAQETLSITFDGDDLDLEDGDVFEYDSVDYEIKLDFNSAGLYKIVVMED